MSTLAWFHCFAGIAGDMALGSLLDAGADIDEVRAIVGRLPIGGWDIDLEAVQKAGLGANHAIVTTSDDGTVVRTYAHVTGLIEEARLPDRVRVRSQATFAALAEAESHLRRQPIERVHFQEISGLDAIVEVVGVCAALEVLGVDDVAASPVALGFGTVNAGSGNFPNPVPLVASLLASRNVPTFGRDVPMELTTPTGAAMLSALCTRFGPSPEMTIQLVGYGAGTRDIDGMPNVLQVLVGESTNREVVTQPLVLLETNVDDLSGEILGHCVDALMGAGAIDAWLTPIVQRRGRASHTVSALCDHSLAEQLRSVMAAETGALGVRTTTTDAFVATRQFATVDVEGMPVRIKVGTGRAKADFDDAAKVARRTGLPLREVLARAEQAWKKAQEQRVLHPSGIVFREP